MPLLGDASREFRNVQVAIRFVLRITILCVFATLGNLGFASSLVVLLGMSAIMSIAVGVARRESMFDSALTDWDEAAAYGSLCCLVYGIAHATAL
jgi:hypothetical protein